MSTRSSARNIFPPLDNPELTIRRRSRSDPTLLNNSEMAAEGPGDLPVPDLWTMEELCQPSLNGLGGPIVPITIQAMNFGLKNDMIQQSIKVNGVTDDALRLYIFPHSLTHHATAWFDRLLRNSINTFDQMAKMFLEKYFSPSMVTKLRNEITNFPQRPDESLFEAWERGTFMKRRPEECYDLIENMTAYHNDWDTSAQRSESSNSITSSDTKIAALKAKMAEINKNLMRVLQVNQQVKAVTSNCETCGGPHLFNNCLATIGNTQKVYAAGAYQGFNQNQNRNNQNHNFQNQKRSQGYHRHQGNNQGRNQFFHGANQGQNQPPTYQAPTYQASVYQAPVHQPQIPQPQVVTTNEFTYFKKENDVIIKIMQTNMTSLTNSNLELKNMFGQFMKMNTASSSGSRTLPSNTITNPKEDLKVERETKATKDMVHPANNRSTEDVQPLVVSTEYPILNSEPVNSPIIEPVASPVSAPKPNQRPSIPYPSRSQDQKLHDNANDQREKLFQILKDLNFNISFADALILTPKFGPSIKSLLTNKDKLYELARTPLNEHCLAVLLKMLLEKLGDPGKFLIPYDFPGMAECLALADLDASIKLADRLISRPVRVAEDVFIKVGTFHFPADFVVVDFDVDPREVHSLSDVIASSNPTPYYDPIVSTTSSTLTLFENSDFFSKRGGILLLEAFLNDDPSLPPPNQGNYLPEVRKELKICEAKTDKSSIDEHPEVKLKDLPPHLEYAFLEGDDKLPVIIAKDLSVEEKTALITVLKSHKRAIAWKLSDIKDQEKTTFTCPYEMFAYRRMPFGLCSAPGTFQSCLSHLEKMLKRCEDTNLCLNWEKSHFMVKEGIVLGHKISKEWIELMCDASDFDIGAVLGQCQEKHFRPIQYASKTMTEAKSNYTTTEKEIQAYENSLIYKEKTKKLHESKIKDHVFNISDRVLRFNSQLNIFSGKLKSCWSGPFTISHVFPYGTVELSQPDGPNFKVNGHRLKHYVGKDVPKMVVLDLQTFLKDH
uniref:Reverse transcriptase domain-containing protein n=1 Tax=Tanacetum cinerariifolium TaxID=118510 RepID=A0A6L2MXY2_TANCI|nr:reverse transcriptase domain-containing protein [Tanacetum cinerariifolium]